MDFTFTALDGLTQEEIEEAYDRGLRFEEMWHELRFNLQGEPKYAVVVPQFWLRKMTKKEKEHFPEGV